jgi:hypothetical protein
MRPEDPVTSNVFIVIKLRNQVHCISRIIVSSTRDHSMVEQAFPIRKLSDIIPCKSESLRAAAHFNAAKILASLFSRKT